MTARLTPDQVDGFQRDGFLVLPDFASRAACRELKARAEELVDEFDAEAHRSVFTTNEQTRHSDEEFLTSGDRIAFFFEEGAFADDGSLQVPKAQAINKIGHALHDLDPTFERFSYTADLAAVARDIGPNDALALQSMYIFKQPHIGGEVGCHQDATFLITEPMTVTGFWFAVEDATLENGCLWAAPGGHRGPLRELFKRTPDGRGTMFEELDATPLPTPPDDLVPLEVEAGTMVVLHGRLPHWSDVNRSAKSRHAYSLHCISAGATYPRWNWLQRRDSMPLRRLDRVLTS
jgi:phytanoyl-CoA hydroxylase